MMTTHRQRVDVLSIKGKLGAITTLPPKGLEIRPFTLFIGQQGTGKSLVSQLAFFFENLPFLLAYVEAERGEQEPQVLLRYILDGLRSRERAFGVFADPSVTVCWRSPLHAKKLCFHMDCRNRQVTPWRALSDYIQEQEALSIPPRGYALYVPAERMLYAHSAKPSTWRLLSLPNTLTLFADAVEDAASLLANWEGGVPDTEAGRKAYEMSRRMLGGYAYRWGTVWKWRFEEDKQIDIDMASSGQKANWALALLAQVLPTWKARREIGTPFTLHVEEPEIHLHPQAQKRMVHLLAYLVRQGFRVVVTTHSLTVLYTLNNLLLASALGDVPFEGVPAPEVRLQPGEVAAYLFERSGRVRDILSREARFIDETTLGSVGDDLGEEMNRILQLQHAREDGEG